MRVAISSDNCCKRVISSGLNAIAVFSFPEKVSIKKAHSFILVGVKSFPKMVLHTPTSRGGRPGYSGGRSSQVLPSSARPPDEWYCPPHCLGVVGNMCLLALIPQTAGPVRMHRASLVATFPTTDDRCVFFKDISHGRAEDAAPVSLL